MNSTSNPTIKWAERKDRLFVTIILNDVKSPKIEITSENHLTFSGESNNKQYSLDIELFGEVDRENSKWVTATRNIFLNIKKKTSGPYWNYLNKDKKKYNFITVDWNYYIDEDEEDEKNSGMGGGFPGMEGMGGMEGMMGNRKY